MKKLFCLLLTLISVVSLCSLSALATNASLNSDYTIDTAYEYPIVPGTPEWNQLDSLDEKIAACHVDDSLLTSMTTPALLETVLNYPLLINMYAYSNPEMGIDSIAQYFNGLNLLFERDDAYDCIVALSQTATYSEDNAETIVRNNYLASLTYHIENSNISPLVVTPSGSNVDSYYNLTWEDWAEIDPRNAWTKEKAQANHDALARAYPKATVVSGINPAYNCHSYAWYSTSTNNKYWIDDPNPYMGDGSYTRQSSASVGNKACWAGNTHSAIVRSVSGNSVTYISKWGFNGVFIHSANDCPYSGTISYWG